MATVARELDLTAVTRIGARRWTVASRTTAGVVYTVVQLPNSRHLECSCNAALHGRHCWHRDAVNATIEREQRMRRAARQAESESERAERIAELTRQAATIFMTAGRR